MQTHIQDTWSLEEIQTLYDSPLLNLIFQAGKVHRQHHNASEVQVCSLISIKTGGCPEDCKYCSQSSKYKTFVNATPLMESDDVLTMAQTAIAQGASRICLGAAWREVRDNKQFDRVIEIVSMLANQGVEVCCCLGMIQEHQAKKLAQAGLHAYNHNLDTSREFYNSIVTTRSYDDRLKTLEAVEQAGINVCCGGIIGLGEDKKDRIALIHTLANRRNHPESVPINLLTPMPGTPLEKQPKLSLWETLRMIATTRIVMPKAMVRLSAGRIDMTWEQQALCFLAGANSIFLGSKLLTAPNPSTESDHDMLELFGLTPKAPKTSSERQVGS